MLRSCRSAKGDTRETVTAEKLQAIVVLGRAKSRIKDYYDLWLLADRFVFEDDRLARAIQAPSPAAALNSQLACPMD